MSSCPDPNLSDFYDRVARIEKAHARGFGFEAEGTLGRSHYVKPMRRSRRLLVAPLVLLLCSGVLLKAVLLWRVGVPHYQSRIELLMQQEGLDRLGAQVMQIDPVTRIVAEALTQVFPPHAGPERF